MPKKTKKAAKKQAVGADPNADALRDEEEAAQGAALLAEAMRGMHFSSPLHERVSLNLDSVTLAHPLVMVTPASAVTDELKAKAAKWEAWDSTNEEPKFTFVYEYEERIFCTKGKAVITPTAGALISPMAVDSDLSSQATEVKPFTIQAGDSAVLMEGFACTWEIIEPMEYQWVYTGSVVTYGWAHVWCDSEKELGTARGRERLGHPQPVS